MGNKSKKIGKKKIKQKHKKKKLPFGRFWEDNCGDGRGKGKFPLLTWKDAELERRVWSKMTVDSWDIILPWSLKYI
jgi:hypothetical protein